MLSVYSYSTTDSFVKISRIGNYAIYSSRHGAEKSLHPERDMDNTTVQQWPFYTLALSVFVQNLVGRPPPA